MNFLRMPDSPTWCFCPNLQRQKNWACTVLPKQKAVEISWIFFSVKEYFFYRPYTLGDVAKAFDHHEIDGNHRRLAIQFSTEFNKIAKAKFCRPYRGLSDSQGWCSCVFFQLITKRQWIWNILIIESFNEFIYLKSDVLILSGKWRWWPSIVRILICLE